MKKKILACALFSLFSSHVFSETTLTLDTTKTYQQIDGFGAFLTNVVSYLRDEGIPVNYLSPINEPTWDWEDPKQEGNRYNIQEMKAVYLSVYDALKKAGLHHEVEVDGGESVQYMSELSDEGYMAFTGDDHPYNKGMNKTDFGSYKNYIPELLGDPEVRKALSNKISLHVYFSDNSEKNMDELRDRIWDEIQAASPGTSVWMSEICILGEAVDIRPFSGGG